MNSKDSVVTFAARCLGLCFIGIITLSMSSSIGCSAKDIDHNSTADGEPKSTSEAKKDKKPDSTGSSVIENQ